MKTSPRWFLWFLLPWAVGFVLLTLLPLIGSATLSCMRVNRGLTSAVPGWVGLAHYEHALEVDRTRPPLPGDPWYIHALGGQPGDPRFYGSMYNSLFYTLFAVPLGLCSSLAVALLLNRSFRGATLVRSLIYLPHVLGGVATIVIWSWLFNPRFGWINEGIRMFYGLLDPMVSLLCEGGTGDWPLPRWLHSPSGCKPAVIIMHAWTMGGSMLIFLAALRRVPQVLVEAAALDGAGRWRRFRHVTVPQISPAILFNATIGLIFTMQSFSESYLLQNRDQGGGLLFYVAHLYETAFEPPYALGYACALGWILCGVLIVLTLPMALGSRRWVHYGE